MNYLKKMTMKLKKTKKYAHIRSERDLDNEIIRLKLKKSIIEQELSNNVSDFKESMRPINIFREAIGISGHSNKLQFLGEGDNIFQSGKVFTWVKYLALTVATLKGGRRIINTVKRIF